MKTTIINNPTIKTTKQDSIKRTEAILSRITDNWALIWTQPVKGFKFEIMCYAVNGKMLFVQIFEHGSVFHFGQTNARSGAIASNQFAVVSIVNAIIQKL